MDKKLFGILTIIFNAYGVPCFMQGDTKTGIMRIVLCIVTFGIVGIINLIKGIKLGIAILNMDDAEFQAKWKTLNDGIPAQK